MSNKALAIDPSEFKTTLKRVITRRGVMWLGQTCNLRCHFCYFLDRIESKAHPEHPFMSIDKAKHICSTLVDLYGNNAIDIQGGEPTVYKEIYELISHCREIGLLPTLITNALLLEDIDKCHQLKDAGIRDLLVSVQGLRETYDEIVGVKGAHKKQEAGLRNIAAAGIPMRFNCVLSKPALPQLREIAQLAVDYNVRVVNFLAFNPFEDQQLSGKRSAVNVPTYSEVSGYLNEAMDILDAAGIECNVRYFPICMVEPRHRKSIYNFQQLPYDIHEWDYASWSWTGLQPQRMKAGDVSPTNALEELNYEPVRYQWPFKYVADWVRKSVHRNPKLKEPARIVNKTIGNIVHGNFGQRQLNKDELYRQNAQMRASQHCRYVYDSACSKCTIKNICDGFHGDYAELFGSGEARPITDIQRIDDPKYFISNQEKVVEAEDYDWAL